MVVRNMKTVDIKKYDMFVVWYMKYSNIRKLKIKDCVHTRYVYDKKDKSKVCQESHAYSKSSYHISNDWYHKYIEDIQPNESEKDFGLGNKHL